MGELQIERLEELLSGYLGPNREIVKSNITPLTAPGENYGSVMLKLDVTLRNRTDGKEDMLYAVAKKIPDNEMFQEAFNIQVTYRNEVNWYSKVVPILVDFQKSLGIKSVISSFPEIYGARLNLNNSTNIDKDAVFVLENVQISGFRNIDRMVGFDLETAKLVLRSMAELHAVPLALKLKQPDVFEKKVKIHTHNFVFKGMGELFDQALLEILSEKEKCKSMSTGSQYVSRSTSVVKAELEVWNAAMTITSPTPKPVLECLDKCDQKLYPNIYTLLQILATIPVSTATPERTFSSLRRLKNYLRNTTSENRPNGLAMG